MRQGVTISASGDTDEVDHYLLKRGQLMNSDNRTGIFQKPLMALLLAFSAAFVAAPLAQARVVVETRSDLGIIKGIVRDAGGTPIADATVAIFRAGTVKLLKQVKSASDGSFLTKIIPGTYTILAVAQGFNPVTLKAVEVERSAELVYGFNLERAGSGNTLPEKRLDRNNSKWPIRAAQMQRSIYQHGDGNAPVVASTTSDDDTETSDITEPDSKGRVTGVVETYFGTSRDGQFEGVNFAALLPVSNASSLVIAGQTGRGKAAPQRFEADLKFRPSAGHQVRVNTSFGKLGTITSQNRQKSLGQLSFQALDEWNVREGVIVVYGIDYSRFVGAGNDYSISPRLGFQYDIDPKTRLRAAYTTQTQEKTWSQAVDLEDGSIEFSEPVAVDDLVVTNNKPRMNKSSRVEFGIERVLDNKSSVEADAFVDTTLGRGVGLINIPFDALDGNFGEFVSNQQGRSTGVRVVYTRRLNGRYSTSAGYAFGNGQKLSAAAISNPANLFDSGFFQTLFGQFEADLKTGTNVKTIFRLSPQATVFAIDPFQGRLAIYDPTLSVLVTQSLPNLGFPFHAEAIVDARNLFGFQTGVSNEEGALRLNSQGRALRGGILVRF